MSPGRRKKPTRPRRKWSRSPVQKPHSTPRGKKTYDRRAEKRRLREESDASS